MRQILFRGKRLDNGEWVYGSLVKDSDTATTAIMDFVDISSSELLWHSIHTVEPATVGQLQNALTERAGFKVFEGDIIQHELYEGLGEPETFNRQFKETVTINKSYAFYKNVQLLGNIHDNPELL